VSITPESLDNQERGLHLTNRESGDDKRRKPKSADLDDAEVTLKALRKRISALKAKSPPDKEPHCGACFRRGVKAAVAAIEEG
jgi:hypothetical protein